MNSRNPEMKPECNMQFQKHCKSHGVLASNYAKSPLHVEFCVVTHLRPTEAYHIISLTVAPEII